MLDAMGREVSCVWSEAQFVDCFCMYHPFAPGKVLRVGCKGVPRSTTPVDRNLTIISDGMALKSIELSLRCPDLGHYNYSGIYLGTRPFRV